MSVSGVETTKSNKLNFQLLLAVISLSVFSYLMLFHYFKRTKAIRTLNSVFNKLRTFFLALANVKHIFSHQLCVHLFCYANIRSIFGICAIVPEASNMSGD